MICRSRRFVGRRGDLETRRRGREEESRLLGSDLLRRLEDLRWEGCQWVIPNLKAPTPKEVITHLPISNLYSAPKFTSFKTAEEEVERECWYQNIKDA